MNFNLKKLISFLLVTLVSFFTLVADCQAQESNSLLVIADANGATLTREKASPKPLTCTGVVAAPSIVGNYLDNYGYPQNITSNKWIMGDSIFTYCQVKNSKNKLIAQNGSSNPYFPNLYSQFDWTTYENSLWYCQIVYDAPTPQAAASSPPANSTNPTTGGCAQFPWSKLIPITP